jgi:hypothetical protein
VSGNEATVLIFKRRFSGEGGVNSGADGAAGGGSQLATRIT